MPRRAAQVETVGGWPVPALKTLSKAMLLEGPRAMCFHRSAAFVFDVPGSVLRIGTFQPYDNPAAHESLVPFIHCWAEFKGYAYAPTTIGPRTGGKLLAMAPDHYYSINGATDVRELTRPELLRLDRRYGLKSHLLRFKPLKEGAKFGGVLCDAAGVPFEVTKEGGMVPPTIEGETK
jgi:hypothetical protein